MALDQNQKINIALGIGVLVTLLLGIFLLGIVISDDSSEITKATSQNVLVFSTPTKSTASDKSTTKSELGQTLKEQQSKNAPTTINNVDIDISVPIIYSYAKPYYYKPYGKYGYNYGYYKPSYNNNYNKYYNSYYPYNNHGFYYSNSYGTWHKYNSW